MSARRLVELPYQADPVAVFAALRAEPWPVLLDSGGYGGERARFDIIAADPTATLETRGNETRIARRDHEAIQSADDPFTLVRRCLGAVGTRPPAGLPFAGGAIGFFGYDLARRLEQLPTIAHADEDIPDMAIGIYDWAFVSDHAQRRSWLVAAGRDPRTHERWRQLAATLRAPTPSEGAQAEHFVAGSAHANLDAAAYRRAFERIHAWLRAGDCYQVNLAQRFEAPAQGPGWQAYRTLRGRSRAPFGALLELPEVTVLSASPERFLRIDADGGVETCPIKGTRARGADAASDRALAQELIDSPKDRAENVMIVDLLRNDLGRVCRAGSVRVPQLFGLETFPGVHHLVSRVTGALAPARHALDALRACFPGGSITGAPKIRAMEIIETLEPHRRGVYCGAIGYVGFDGAMDTSIAIRTLIYSHGRIRCWAGGGIVMDSDAGAEYQETFDKAAGMLALFEGTVECDHS